MTLNIEYQNTSIEKGKKINMKLIFKMWCLVDLCFCSKNVYNLFKILMSCSWVFTIYSIPGSFLTSICRHIWLLYFKKALTFSKVNRKLFTRNFFSVLISHTSPQRKFLYCLNFNTSKVYLVFCFCYFAT